MKYFRPFLSYDHNWDAPVCIFPSQSNRDTRCRHHTEVKCQNTNTQKHAVLQKNKTKHGKQSKTCKKHKIGVTEEKLVRTYRNTQGGKWKIWTELIYTQEEGLTELRCSTLGRSQVIAQGQKVSGGGIWDRDQTGNTRRRLFCRHSASILCLSFRKAINKLHPPTRGCSRRTFSFSYMRLWF